MKDFKSFWWVALSSGAGMALLMLGVFIFSFHPLALGAFIVESVLVAAAIVNLKRLYAEFPPPWTGRWQLSLSDMLSIVFFFGLLMTAFYTLDPAYFAYTIPAVMALGAGYVVALLFVSRMDESLGGFTKWMTAVAVAIAAIFITGWGMGMQMLLVAIAAVLFGR